MSLVRGKDHNLDFHSTPEGKDHVYGQSGSSGVSSLMRSLVSGWGGRYSSRGSRKAWLIAFASSWSVRFSIPLI